MLISLHLKICAKESDQLTNAELPNQDNYFGFN